MEENYNSICCPQHIVNPLFEPHTQIQEPAHAFQPPRSISSFPSTLNMNIWNDTGGWDIIKGLKPAYIPHGRAHLAPIWGEATVRRMGGPQYDSLTFYGARTSVQLLRRLFLKTLIGTSRLGTRPVLYIYKPFQ
jgi:hypothetical protein